MAGLSFCDRRDKIDYGKWHMGYPRGSTRSVSVFQKTLWHDTEYAAKHVLDAGKKVQYC